MDAVFGNVGTIITFRVGAEDAEFLEKWFQPDFMMNDIVNLGKYTVYLKLMINGVSSKGFSADMLRPFSLPEKSNREAIIAYSREKYGTPREVVQKEIAEWSRPIAEEGVTEERREYRPDRGPRPRRFDSPPPMRRDDRRPAPKPASMGTALRGGAVDFRGRRMEDKPKENKPKKEVDTSELKKILEETLGKKQE